MRKKNSSDYNNSYVQMVNTAMVPFVNSALHHAQYVPQIQFALSAGQIILN